MAADKGMTMRRTAKTTAISCWSTIEAAKDQFTEEELKLLKGEATEDSRHIENKLDRAGGKVPRAACRNPWMAI